MIKMRSRRHCTVLLLYIDKQGIRPEHILLQRPQGSLRKSRETRPNQN